MDFTPFLWWQRNGVPKKPLARDNFSLNLLAIRWLFYLYRMLERA